jgi:hypothetical protein
MAWPSKAEGDQQRKHPRPQKRRRLLFIVLIPAMLAGIGSVVLAKKWPYTQERITQDLRKHSTAKSHLQVSRATYFPHPDCVAERPRLDAASDVAGIRSTRHRSQAGHSGRLNGLYLPARLCRPGDSRGFPSSRATPRFDCECSLNSERYIEVQHSDRQGDRRRSGG